MDDDGLLLGVRTIDEKVDSMGFRVDDGSR